MITIERLKELVSQNKTIYGLKRNKVNAFDLSLNARISRKIKCVETDKDRYFFYQLFEEKKDAEFIRKYHTTKTLKFEPPTWKEFLSTRDENKSIYAHWDCKDVCIVMVEENNEKGILKTYNQFEVDTFKSFDDKERKFDYINSDGFDDREETYYKALEYARNLFLGESNVKD